jgi:hypothetical protein
MSAKLVWGDAPQGGVGAKGSWENHSFMNTGSREPQPRVFPQKSEIFQKIPKIEQIITFAGQPYWVRYCQPWDTSKGPASAWSLVDSHAVWPELHTKQNPIYLFRIRYDPKSRGAILGVVPTFTKYNGDMAKWAKLICCVVCTYSVTAFCALVSQIVPPSRGSLCVAWRWSLFSPVVRHQKVDGNLRHILNTQAWVVDRKSYYHYIASWNGCWRKQKHSFDLYHDSLFELQREACRSSEKCSSCFYQR